MKPNNETSFCHGQSDADTVGCLGNQTGLC